MKWPGGVGGHSRLDLWGWGHWRNWLSEGPGSPSQPLVGSGSLKRKTCGCVHVSQSNQPVWCEQGHCWLRETIEVRKKLMKTANNGNSNPFGGNSCTKRPDTVEKSSLQRGHCVWVQGISQEPGTLRGQKRYAVCGGGTSQTVPWQRHPLVRRVQNVQECPKIKA